MDKYMRREMELAATEVEQTITAIEAAVGTVLATLPSDRLVRLGLLAAHPDAIEDRLGLEVGDWLDAVAPLVGRALQDRGPDRVGHALRTRALVGAIQEGLSIRDQPA